MKDNSGQGLGHEFLVDFNVPRADPHRETLTKAGKGGNNKGIKYNPPHKLLTG